MKNKQGFTIIELIVVVTLISILGTIGYISYNGYVSESRDANRVSQVSSIYKALEAYRTKGFFPIPDRKITVYASGTIIGYQGYMGEDALNIIGYQDGGKDPKDNEYFTYYLTKDLRKAQLMTFLEDEIEISYGIIDKVNATNYNYRIPKVYGAKLGVLTESGTNTPIQEVTSIVATGSLDIVKTTSSFIAYISNDYVVSGTGSVLAFLKDGAGKSCKDILSKDSGKKGYDGIYYINPTGTGSFQVYCDMTTDDGGWTSLVRFNPSLNNSYYWSSPQIVGDYYNYLDKRSYFDIKEVYVNKVVGWDGGEYYFKKEGNDLYSKRGQLKNVKIYSNWQGLSGSLSHWIGFTYGASDFIYNSVTYPWVGHNNTGITYYDFPFYDTSTISLSDKPWGGRQYVGNFVVNIFIR